MSAANNAAPRLRPATIRSVSGERTGWPPISRSPRPAPLPIGPSASMRAVLAALAALPRLAADIGFAIAARPDAVVEVLPGSPTTVVFSAGGKLKGLMVVPGTEAETRSLLGLPATAPRDRAADRIWEEGRQEDVGDLDTE